MKLVNEKSYKLDKKFGEWMLNTVKEGTHSLTNEQVPIKKL